MHLCRHANIHAHTQTCPLACPFRELYCGSSLVDALDSIASTSEGGPSRRSMHCRHSATESPTEMLLQRSVPAAHHRIPGIAPHAATPPSSPTASSLSSVSATAAGHKRPPNLQHMPASACRFDRHNGSPD